MKIKFGTHEGGCYSHHPRVRGRVLRRAQPLGQRASQPHVVVLPQRRLRPRRRQVQVQTYPSGQFLCGSKQLLSKGTAEAARPGLLPRPAASRRARAKTNEVRYHHPPCCHQAKRRYRRTASAARSAAGTVRAAIPLRSFCCREPGEPKSPGRCCKKDKESCCGVGPDGAQKRMCCPKPNKCIKQLPSGEEVGSPKTSPWVCCPPARQVPDVPAARGSSRAATQARSGFRGSSLLAQGIRARCCDKDRICGSGASLTCCQQGLIGTETCCDGTCVDMQFNRRRQRTVGRATLPGRGSAPASTAPASTSNRDPLACVWTTVCRQSSGAAAAAGAPMTVVTLVASLVLAAVFAVAGGDEARRPAGHTRGQSSPSARPRGRRVRSRSSCRWPS